MEGHAVVVQDDGRILVAGSIMTTSLDFAVMRYMPDGAPDLSFGGDGLVTIGLTGEDAAKAITLQTDGKILVTGYYTVGGGSDPNRYIAIVRLNTDGSPDTGFGLNGQIWYPIEGQDPTQAEGRSIALQTDGRIVICGSTVHPAGAYTIDVGLIRLDEDGTLDETFGTDGTLAFDIGAANNAGNAMAIQNDGRIIVAGYKGTNHYAISRFLANGQTDPSFANGGTLDHSVTEGQDILNSVVLQADGKIVLAGTFGQEFGAVRYDVNGDLDNTFGNNGIAMFDFPGSGGEAVGLVRQSDGRFILGGTFLDGMAPSKLAIGKLTANGQIDLSFCSTGWQAYEVDGLVDHGTAVALQDDGRIVMTGTLSSVPTRAVVIRVLNDVGIGLEEVKPSLSAMILPNPIGDRGEVRYNMADGGAVDCRLLDMTGRLVRVFWSKEQQTAGAWSRPIEMRGIASGGYVLELRSADALGRFVLVKE